MKKDQVFLIVAGGTLIVNIIESDFLLHDKIGPELHTEYRSFAISSHQVSGSVSTVFISRISS